MRISAKSDLVTIQQQYHVEPKYKKKANKVHSAKVPKLTGDGPGGEPYWKRKIYEKLEPHKCKENKIPKNMHTPHIKLKVSRVARGA